MKFKYIEKNPEICGGKPVFKGTRIPIHIILDFLSAGETIENILENYPQLNKEAILEAKVKGKENKNGKNNNWDSRGY